MPRRHQAEQLFRRTRGRNDLRLSPGWTVFIAPELRRTVVTLEVAGTDARRLDLDQRLAWPRPRDGNFFQLVVLRPVTDDGLHGVGNVVGLTGRGFGHASLHAELRGQRTRAADAPPSRDADQHTNRMSIPNTTSTFPIASPAPPAGLSEYGG